MNNRNFNDRLIGGNNRFKDRFERFTSHFNGFG